LAASIEVEQNFAVEIGFDFAAQVSHVAKTKFYMHIRRGKIICPTGE
jgi:hypothetical protein